MVRNSTKQSLKQWLWLATIVLGIIAILPIAIPIWAIAEFLRWRDRRKNGENGRIFIGKT